MDVTSKQLRLEFIQALRETKYRQCRDRLYFCYYWRSDGKGGQTTDGYLQACALGVALDVLRKYYPNEEDIVAWDAKRFIKRFDFPLKEPYGAITHWNDKKEWSFKQIADALEKFEKKMERKEKDDNPPT